MTSMTVYLSGLLVLTVVIMEEYYIKFLCLDCVVLLAAFTDTTFTRGNTIWARNYNASLKLRKT